LLSAVAQPLAESGDSEEAAGIESYDVPVRLSYRVDKFYGIDHTAPNPSARTSLFRLDLSVILHWSDQYISHLYDSSTGTRQPANPTETLLDDVGRSSGGGAAEQAEANASSGAAGASSASGNLESSEYASEEDYGTSIDEETPKPDQGGEKPKKQNLRSGQKEGDHEAAGAAGGGSNTTASVNSTERNGVTFLSPKDVWDFLQKGLIWVPEVRFVGGAVTSSPVYNATAITRNGDVFALYKFNNVETTTLLSSLNYPFDTQTLKLKFVVTDPLPNLQYEYLHKIHSDPLTMEARQEGHSFPPGPQGPGAQQQFGTGANNAPAVRTEEDGQSTPVFAVQKRRVIRLEIVNSLSELFSHLHLKHLTGPIDDVLLPGDLPGWGNDYLRGQGVETSDPRPHAMIPDEWLVQDVSARLSTMKGANSVWTTLMPSPLLEEVLKMSRGGVLAGVPPPATPSEICYIPPEADRPISGVTLGARSDGDADEGATKSKATHPPCGAVELRVVVKRHLLLIIHRLILPLVFLTLLSWGGFWLGPSVYAKEGQWAGRLAIPVFAFFLMLIFQNYIMSPPQIPAGVLTRETWLHTFMIFTLYYCLMAVLQTVLAYILTEKVSAIVGGWLDRLSRLVFPLVYVLFLALSFALTNHPQILALVLHIAFGIMLLSLLGTSLYWAALFKRTALRHLVDLAVNDKMMCRPEVCGDVQEARKLFRYLDPAGRFILSPHDIVDVLRYGGVDLSERELELLEDRLRDICGDYISYIELYRHAPVIFGSGLREAAKRDVTSSRPARNVTSVRGRRRRNNNSSSGNDQLDYPQKQASKSQAAVHGADFIDATANLSADLTRGFRSSLSKLSPNRPPASPLPGAKGTGLGGRPRDRELMETVVHPSPSPTQGQRQGRDESSPRAVASQSPSQQSSWTSRGTASPVTDGRSMEQKERTGGFERPGWRADEVCEGSPSSLAMSSPYSGQNEAMAANQHQTGGNGTGSNSSVTFSVTPSVESSTFMLSCSTPGSHPVSPGHSPPHSPTSTPWMATPRTAQQQPQQAGADKGGASANDWQSRQQASQAVGTSAPVVAHVPREETPSSYSSFGSLSRCRQRDPNSSPLVGPHRLVERRPTVAMESALQWAAKERQTASGTGEGGGGREGQHGESLSPCFRPRERHPERTELVRQRLSLPVDMLMRKSLNEYAAELEQRDHIADGDDVGSPLLRDGSRTLSADRHGSSSAANRSHSTPRTAMTSLAMRKRGLSINIETPPDPPPTSLTSPRRKGKRGRIGWLLDGEQGGEGGGADMDEGNGVMRLRASVSGARGDRTPPSRVAQGEEGVCWERPAVAAWAHQGDAL